MKQNQRHRQAGRGRRRYFPRRRRRGGIFRQRCRGGFRILRRADKEG
jgi:hypothetical protein